MKKARSFQFTYPVTDFKQKPAMHVCDIEVNATVFQFTDGSLLLDDDEKVYVEIDSIVQDGKNITNVIDAVADNFYTQLQEAAREHGKDRFEINSETNEIENGYEASVHSEEWMNNQAEQELLSHE